MKISHIILLILIMAVIAYGALVPEVLPTPLRPIFAVLFLAEYFVLPLMPIIAYGAVMDSAWRVAKYGGNAHPFLRKICIALVKERL